MGSDEEVLSGVVAFCGSTAWDLMGRNALPRHLVMEGRASGGGQEVLQPVLLQGGLRVGEGVDGLRRVRRVIAGPVSTHALVITVENQVFIWGRNEHGQLGFADRMRRNLPTLLVDRHGKPVLCRDAACGRSHTILLAEDGTVYACGSNKAGQLGIGSMSQEWVASLYKVAFPAEVKVVSLSAGGEFSVALDEDGNLWTWGHPEHGQLGHGTDGSYFEKGNKLSFNYELRPRKVQGLAEPKIIAVRCGVNHTVALDDQKQVWTFGFGGYGRLGHGVPKDELSPRKVESLQRAKGALTISCGATCTYVRTVSGTTLMFGQTKRTGEANMYPKPIHDLQGWNVRSVSCGPSSTVVAADESLISWGPSPTFGELGYGESSAKSSTKPKLIDAMEGLHVHEVSVGFSFTLMLVRCDSEEDKKKLSLIPTLEEFEVEIPSEKVSGKKRKASESKSSRGKTKQV